MGMSGSLIDKLEELGLAEQGVVTPSQKMFAAMRLVKHHAHHAHPIYENAPVAGQYPSQQYPYPPQQGGYPGQQGYPSQPVQYQGSYAQRPVQEGEYNPIIIDGTQPSASNGPFSEG